MIRLIQAAAAAILSIPASIAASADSQSPGGDMTAVRYENAYWYSDGVFIEGSRCVRDGKFIDGENCGLQTRIADLEGKYVVPPYADAHTHAFLFTTASQHKAVLDNLAERGVFYAMEQDSYEALPPATAAMIAKGSTPDIIATHTIVSGSGAAPIVFKSQMNAQRAVAGQTPPAGEGRLFYTVDNRYDAARVGAAFDNRNDLDFIKIILAYSADHDQRAGDPDFEFQVGLDPDLIGSLVRAARKAGKPSSVHIEDAADFRVAAAAGAGFIAHLPASWRVAPGAGFASTGYSDIDLKRWLISAADARAAAAKNIAVITTTTRDRRHIDYMRMAEIYRANLKLLFEAGANVILGADAGGNIIDETIHVADLAGLDNSSAIDLLTIRTARAIFPDRKLGGFEPGYEASFLALDKNPLDDLENLRSIALRIKQGKEILADETVPAKMERDGETLEYQGSQVAAGVWELSVPGRPYADTIGVIDAGDSFVLIDTGYPEGEESIRAALKELGDKPVRTVINTHFHHTFANALFAGEATIYAHSGVKPRMGQELLMYGRVPYGPFPEKDWPDVDLVEDTTLHIGGWKLEIWRLPPSHTDGDLIIFASNQSTGADVVFTGDMVVNGLAAPDLANGGDITGYEVTLTRLAARVSGLTPIVTGHGGLIRGMDIEDQQAAYRQVFERIEKDARAGVPKAEFMAAEFSPIVTKWVKQPGSLPADFIKSTLYPDAENAE